MASGIVRLLARTLRDVTSVRGEDLRDGHAPQGSPPPAPVASASPATPVFPASPARAQVVCVASGKGGTGKTIVTTNLAVALAGRGLSVTLLDADMGLANAHLLMGVRPEHDVSAVLAGTKHLPEIAVDCPAGVKLLSGGSGMAELAELPSAKVELLADELRLCEETADVILVDLAAGIGPQVMRFLTAAHAILIVTTPDATALLDAYATIKSLAAAGVTTPIRMVVNRAADRADAIEAFKKIQAVAARHGVQASLAFFGWVPQHWFVQESVKLRHPVVLSHPRSFVAAQIGLIAQGLATEHRAWVARQTVVPLDPGARGPGPDAAFSAKLAEASIR